MPRIARVVVPGFPHHVTQRGNRRQTTFFKPADYRAYMKMIAGEKDKAEVEIWAYCLMPNHTHLVVVPRSALSLSMLFKEAHRRYTRRINEREGWRGHLWQERFHSFPMDEEHLIAAVRYVERNPVRAGLCGSVEDWQWSSVHAHCRREDDLLVSVAPMLERIRDWHAYVAANDSDTFVGRFRRHARSGRPAGSKPFIDELEKRTGRRLHKRRPGRAKGI